jgi:bile acid transporter
MVCDSTHCATAAAGLLSLSCGERSGEVIKAVKLGARASCFDVSTDISCSLDAAQAEAEAQCLDKLDCTVNWATAGCGANTTLAVEVGCDTVNATLTVLITILICIIGFALGTTLTSDNFREILRNKKRAFFVGFSSQVGFMPLMAFAFSHGFGFDTLVAVGVVLCGCAPGGTTSNLFTYWADGNVALSIAMSAMSTLLALGTLPLLIVIYIQTGSLGDDGDDDVQMAWGSIFIGLVTILVPVFLGVLLRRYTEKWKPLRVGSVQLPLHEWVEKIGSLIGICFLIAALVVGLRQYPDITNPRNYPKEWGLACFFQPLGCAFGYCVSWLAGLDFADQKAVAFETGVQNYALVIAIITLSYTGCDRADALTFPLIASVPPARVEPPISWPRVPRLLIRRLTVRTSLQVWYVLWSAVLTLAFVGYKRWKRGREPSNSKPPPTKSAASLNAGDDVPVGVV